MITLHRTASPLDRDTHMLQGQRQITDKALCERMKLTRNKWVHRRIQLRLVMISIVSFHFMGEREDEGRARGAAPQLRLTTTDLLDSDGCHRDRGVCGCIKSVIKV